MESDAFFRLTKNNKRFTVGLEYGAAPRNFAKFPDELIRITSNSFKLILEIVVGQKILNQ